jgi:EAL domain-containing protein (putative c-di-GMP-specific phosphodiesterase class I)
MEAHQRPAMNDIRDADLRRAIETDQLALLYQPQVAADGVSLAAVEAVVRWDHSSRGRLGPQAFVPLAESSGLIDPLGEWVLRRACRDALRWPGLCVSVNVSPLQFRRPDFVATVEAIARDAGAPIAQIELEILETAVFDNEAHAESDLRALRDLGFRIALDDFGAGYTSLAYLRRLPFDKLKIDKCFIDDIGSLRGVAIVQAIVALARALGMKVTAEGVETAAQHRVLRAAGCHYLQGFLFSPPVSAEAIDALWLGDRARVPEPPLGAAGARGIL